MSHGLPNLEARVMDGQALKLSDASFDAAFSMFGIMLFPDWRKGLSEMARVVRPGGIGSVGTWKETAGAAANLLLAEQIAELCPEMELPTPVEGMNELRDVDRFGAAMIDAGFADVDHRGDKRLPGGRSGIGKPRPPFRVQPSMAADRQPAT